ncbi:FxSxx-COOH cyclophane-containing RiPP peptide [Streptomyces sp. NPDC001709]
MDAPQESSRTTALVDIAGVSPRLLETAAAMDTALGHALRRRLQEADRPQRTIDVVFDSAL